MTFLMRNYKVKHCEIDLVFLDGETLCFVEVKTRHRQNFYRPADAVNKTKQDNIRLAAKEYLKVLGKKKAPHRFDIVEVIFNGRRLVEVTHLVNAFE